MVTENTCLPHPVVLIGVNHACGSVEIRDRLLFSAHELERGLTLLKSHGAFSESLILSTCNRIELYSVMADERDARNTLLDFLSSFHNIPRTEFESHFYSYSGGEAVAHLFDVAASLDSLVVGEYQILGQVKDAHTAAQRMGNTGTVLNRLFQAAITAGKRVRAETRIGEGSLSVSFAAVKLAKKILGQLEHRTALIVGAGEMSELTVKHLKQTGIGRVIFTNRTLEKSMALVREHGGRAVEYPEMKKVLHECDVVISATASPHYVLSVADIEAAMQRRNNQPMFLIDIAAPRDIHPDVGGLYNVFLYNIDDLTRVTHDSTHARKAEIEKVNAILDKEIKNFYAWYESLRVRPLLVSLRERFESIRDNELKRYASDIESLSPEARDFIKTFAASLTDKMLQEPSKNLITLSCGEDGDTVAENISRVFKLTPDEKNR